MNIQTNFWRVASTAGVLLTVFLAVLSIKEIKSIAYVGKSDQVVNTISVSGTGYAFAKPDIATFSLSVTETAKTVADAQTQASNKISAALKVLKDANIDDKDVQTQSYSINPHYEYQGVACSVNYCPPTKSVLTGYDVSQSVQVKVRDLSKAGAIFSSIGALGVQNVNGLSFTVDNIEGVKADARTKAISMAQAKADQLSKQLGVTLVRVASFYENGDQPVYGYGMGAGKMSAVDMAPAAAPAPDVPPGQQKVTSNVTITYEIR